MTLSSFVFLVVRLNTAYIYPLCNWTHHWGYCYIFSHLEDFVRTFIWGFVFICCFIYQKYLISNSMIVLDYIRVFPDEIFSICSFLCLIENTLFWILPSNVKFLGTTISRKYSLLYVDLSDAMASLKIH